MVEPEKHKIFEREVGGEAGEFTIVCHETPEGRVCEQVVVEAADVSAPRYNSNADLPEEVRRELPVPVQTVFREAYNHAWTAHVMALRGNLQSNHEEVARRAGWAAVRRLYEVDGSTWIRKSRA